MRNNYTKVGDRSGRRERLPGGNESNRHDVTTEKSMQLDSHVRATRNAPGPQAFLCRNRISVASTMPSGTISTHFGAAIERIDIAIGETSGCSGLALLVARETAVADRREPILSLDAVGIVACLDRRRGDGRKGTDCHQ